MTLFLHGYDNPILLDLEGSAIGEELGIQTFGGLPFIAFKQEGHGSIEVVGRCGHGEVEVDLDYDGSRIPWLR